LEETSGNPFLRGDLAKAVRKRDFRGTAWALGALCLILSAYVWVHITVVRLGYEVQALKAERKSLMNEYYYLQYRMYDVRSLSRVEQTARTSLNMSVPRTDQVVILEEPKARSPKWISWITR
jgi:cell division protein FtsL